MRVRSRTAAPRGAVAGATSRAPPLAGRLAGRPLRARAPAHLGSSQASAQAKDWRIDNLDVDRGRPGERRRGGRREGHLHLQGNYHFVSRVIPTAEHGRDDRHRVCDANGAQLSQGDTPGHVQLCNEGSRQVITGQLRPHRHLGHLDLPLPGQERDPCSSTRATSCAGTCSTRRPPWPSAAVQATVKLPGSVPSEKMTQAVQTGYGVAADASLRPAPSTMVYEATIYPPTPTSGSSPAFPKGVVKYTWTARRIGAFIVPKLGLVLPIALLPGHAPHLAAPRTRRPGQDLCQLRERAPVQPFAGTGRRPHR